MKRSKYVLFHAVPPQSHQPQRDWANFLHATALIDLPDGSEQLAENVWVLPDDRQSYLVLSRIGDAHATETRMLPFSSASDWQPLSRRP